MTTEDDMFDPEQNPYLDKTGPGGRDPYEGDDPYDAETQREQTNPDTRNIGLRGYDNGLWTNIVKPTAYEYGGHRGGAAAEEQRYLGQAQAADARQGAMMTDNPYGADYATDRNLGWSSRMEQGNATALMASAARGEQPSVAENQMYLGLQRAQQQNANALQGSQAAAASMAAGARGGGGNLAAAQRMAALQQGGQAAMANQQMAQLGAQSAWQGAALRAGEMEAARQGYLGATGQMRGQDLQQQGLSGQMAYQQAGLQQQQTAQNDQRAVAEEQMRQKVFEDQLAAQQAGEAQNQGTALGKRQMANEEQKTTDSSFYGLGSFGRLGK